MGLLRRIKKRLPIVGGRGDGPSRPAERFAGTPATDLPPVPPKPTPPDPAEIRSSIEATVKANRIVLFMKGTPQAPMCGFSAAAAAILTETGHEFESFDVIAEPALRQGIKDYSDWPTLPQIYINGEFVGGCDILKEMAENGELATAVGAD